MSALRSCIIRFVSFLLLFLYIGCFVFAPRPPKPKKKRNHRISQSKPSRSRFFFSLNPWPSLKPVFSFASIKKKPPCGSQFPTNLTPCVAETPKSTNTTALSTPTTRKRSSSGSFVDSDFAIDAKPKRPSFTLRNDVFPCSTCGEVFQTSQLLDFHQSTKHAISELFDCDSAKNIVKIIFETSWDSGKASTTPRIDRILKIHNGPKILARFEEYRETIKAKAAKRRGRWNERCMVDGNELLRFQCSTFLCSLGLDGSSGICSHEFCSVCSIIRSGHSPKLDGIATMGNSKGAHESIPEDLEEEFGFMNVKRAMLVCRVVAGRVAREQQVGVVGDADKEDGGFDSVVISGGAPSQEELLVFSPRAVLPCFVIVYSYYSV